MSKKQAVAIPASVRSVEELAAGEILKTAEYLGGLFQDALKPHGVSFTQYSALQILRGEEEGLACSEIAARMITKDSDVTRLVDRLVSRGLVERSRDTQDRRIVKIRLAAAGQELIQRLEPLTLELVSRELAGIKPKRMRRLIETLQQIRQSGKSEEED